MSSSGIDRLMPVVSGSGTVLVAGLHTPGMYGSKKSAGNVTLLRVSRLALFPTFCMWDGPKKSSTFSHNIFLSLHFACKFT